MAVLRRPHTLYIICVIAGPFRLRVPPPQPPVKGSLAKVESKSSDDEDDDYESL